MSLLKYARSLSLRRDRTEARSEETRGTARPLISVHFPKAGGVSFLGALTNAYGGDNIMKDYDDPVDPNNAYWIYPTWFQQHRPLSIEPFKAVHGHFCIQKYDLVSPAIRVVLLREPVDNLISIYYFWQNMFNAATPSHGIYEFAKKQRLSLLEVAEIPKIRRLMSETYFGGFDMRRFDIIGIHERRKEYITKVAAATKLPLSTDFHENITPKSEERGNVMADTALLVRLRHLLRDDIVFYDNIVKDRF